MSKAKRSAPGLRDAADDVIAEIQRARAEHFDKFVAAYQRACTEFFATSPSQEQRLKLFHETVSQADRASRDIWAAFEQRCLLKPIGSDSETV